MPRAPMNELTFRIVLHKPPTGVDFGLQLGRSATSTLVQIQRSTGEDLRFEFPLSIVTAEGSDTPDFRGPASQGRNGERFVYLCIGRYAGQADSPWARRLKVPLTRITGALLQRALQRPSAVLEARVPGTARDGGPNAATVKPFDGWELRL
jgi:uncharacterized protein DUF5990